MSKYIKAIPLSEIERIAIVKGNGRSLSQVKGTADYCMNGGFYDFQTGKPTHHLKADGTVWAKEAWGCWGFGWDSGPDIRMEALPAERKNYIGAYELLSPMVGINDALSYGAELGGVRGRTAMALTGDKLILFCSGDGTKDGRTPEGLREELYKLGAETAIMLDGGGSSQCDFGGGEVIASSRRVHNYICVWLKKKEDKPMDGIAVKYMTGNDCYRAGKTITPKGIMVHSTAAPGVMAEALRESWDKPSITTAVHAMVDDTGVIQTLPWNARGWHAGTGSGGRSANNTHIAFEICEPDMCRLLPVEWVPLRRGGNNPAWAVQRLQMELQARGYDPRGVDGSFGPGCEAALKACQRALGLAADGSCGPGTLAALAKRSGSYLSYDAQGTESYFRAVWGHAVGLCAKLCKEYGLDPMRDILCHSEGYKAGIASNHADVMHWWPQHGESMDNFRAAVRAAMAGESAPDYRAKVQARFGLDPATVDYLAAYRYGADLLRKLATAK